MGGGHPRQGPDGVWYVAQVRPNQQERARTNLERQGYPCFVPRRPVTRRSGRVLATGLGPLFPGYVFVAIAPDRAWRPVNATFGVARLVMRAANTPQPVPAAVMGDLLARSGPDGMLRPVRPPEPGETVRIVAGPMADFVGRVERLAPEERVAVLLEIMGQAVRTELPAAHVAPIAG